MIRGPKARSTVKALATAVVAVLLLFAGTPRASAKNGNKGTCGQRIEKAEFKLDKAIRQHGISSKQAEKSRRKLRAVSERCWSRGQSGWDGRSQGRRNDRDWNHDHESQGRRSDRDWNHDDDDDSREHDRD